MKNDLHVRTNFSASAERNCDYISVLQKLQKAGIKRAAITDFDTCIFHAIAKITDLSQYYKGQMVTGMECDVCYEGKVFELLAYNFDVMKTLQWSYNTYGSLEDRQTKIKDLLIEKIRKTNLKFNYKSQFCGKTDFAHKYVYENLKKYKVNEKFFEENKIKNLSDFYILSTSNKNFTLYVNLNKVFPTVKKVVDFIHSAGGVVVLSQPFRHEDKFGIDKLLQIAKDNKVDGIEVYHPAHNKQQIAYLLDYAQKNRLIITGGSNFNGKPGHQTVGIQNIDKTEKNIYQF